MHCKPTSSDMGDVPKKSFSAGFGVDIGCELDTTEDVIADELSYIALKKCERACGAP